MVVIFSKNDRVEHTHRGNGTMWRRQCVDALRRAVSHGYAGSKGALLPLARQHHRAWVHNAAGSTGFYLDKTKYIVNAYGPDRPGLVSALAKALIDAKGNIETTRMARLGDECNITMLVSFTEQTKEEAEAFERAAGEIPGLRGTVRRTRTRHRRDEEEVDRSRWRRIFLQGPDFPGLVYQMTNYLASEGINVETLNTDTQPAPFGDEDLFTIDAVIEIGPDTSLVRFKKSIERLEKKLGVDIVVSDHERVDDE